MFRWVMALLISAWVIGCSNGGGDPCARLLDETCAGPCRSGGAIPFRNRFGPALFDSLGCVANPRS